MVFANLIHHINNMRKITFKVLLFITALIFAVACSSSKYVNTIDHNQFKDYKPNSIQVVTEDGLEYQFADSSYSFKGDTLFGKGININGKWIPFEGKIPFNEIEKIEFYSYADAWNYKQLIFEFEQFVNEGEKPSVIYVTEFDSMKYLFINSNYYLENDTLYGNGQLFLRKGEEFQDRMIALSDIVSFQFNFANNINISFNYDPTTDSLTNYEDAGSEVYIRMKNGKEYNGEFLSVTDSILIVFENSNEEEDSTFKFYSIKNKDIKLIELRGGNNAIYGIIFGGLIGGVVGVAIGKTDEPKPPPKDPDEWHLDFGVPKINEGAVTGCLIGGIVGAIGGGIIGFNISNYNVVYEYANSKEFDFTKLNKYARYRGSEPYIIKNLE
jgi:small nuclear ribonucleoprotein (snRNP)-like protein